MNILKNLILANLFCFANVIYCQTAPDFTLTDSGGNTHKLYQDYLNQNKVVVLKIFFVFCPPCNAIAPAVQQKYVQWGSGNSGVQFIEISNKLSDNNTLINGYKSMHGITFPSIGAAGGGPAATQPYMDGTFGLWYGTPTFIVIAPNGTVNFNVDFDQLDTAIEAAIPDVVIPPTMVNIASNYPTIPSGVKVLLKPANSANPIYDITALTNGTHLFEYPSALIPAIENPVIYIESAAPAKNNQITVGDLVAIQRHILNLEKLNTPQKLLAADVTNDGKINAADLVSIRKVIIGLTNQFGKPSFLMYPQTPIPINVPAGGGGTVSATIELIKVGNVN